jgi:hypothetical protein
LCLTCGNRLRPDRKSKAFPTEEDAREFARLLDPDRHPRVRHFETWRDNNYLVTYQNGWGKYGQNLFCSESCGYIYAVEKLRPKPRESMADV